MDRDGESNPGSYKVIKVGHEEGKMAVVASSTGGSDVSGIGIQLALQELNGRIGGLAKDRCQLGMREGGCCW